MANQTAQLDCGEHLTIAQLEAWYLQCLKLLLTQQKVLIKVNRLQKVDMAALQLLYVLQQQAMQDGVEVVWSPCSEYFQEMVMLSGLPFVFSEHLDLDRNTPRPMENN